MRNSTREWINAADSDLKVIDSSYDDDENARVFSFLSKTAIEKALKSVIYEYNLGLDNVDIDNLQKLLDIVSNVIIFDIDMKLIKSLDYLFDKSNIINNKIDKIISYNEALIYMDLAREITQEIWELYENDESKYI